MSKHSRGARSSHDHSTEPVQNAHAVPCTSANKLVRWSADTTWKRLKRDLEDFPDGLRVLELCGGIGTGHIALQELLKDIATFIVVDHFDIDEALRPLLIASGLPSQNIHLGRNEGDILKISPGFPIAPLVRCRASLSTLVIHGVSLLMGGC